MKRINIERDVESRRNIASHVPEKKLVTKPSNTTEADAQSEDTGGREADTKAAPVLPSPSKRGRKTQGDTKEV